MRRPPKTRSGLLNRAVDELRSSNPANEVVEASASRVWARVSEPPTASHNPPRAESSALANCEDYLRILPDYLSNRLTEARALLLEDHTQGCLSCRNAVSAARSGSAGPLFVRPGVKRSVWHGWQVWTASAFAALVLFVVFGGAGLVRQMLFPIEIQAAAESITGRLFRVGPSDLEPLAPGEVVGAQTPLRTASDSGAIVRLADGSRIEMGERSEISFVRAADGVRIRLARGNVIVQAAPQASGHLYVSTDDVEVSVVGTVFAVSRGPKGARVSVLEGEVLVSRGATSQSLLPGQQFTSSEELSPVPIEEEIAWSQELERHLALMVELSRISREVSAAVASPQLRFSSPLIELVPADTFVYVAVPNLGASVAEAFEIFSARIQSNPVTREWWDNINQPSGTDTPLSMETLESMVGQLRAFSTQIGPEIVFAVAGSGESVGAIVLAELTDPALVVDLLRGLQVLAPETAPRIVTSAEELAQYDAGGPPLAYIAGAIAAFSPSPSLLADFAAALDTGGAFASTDFHATVASVYAEGADYVFAADLNVIASGIPAPEPAQALLGLDGVDDLVIDYKSVASPPLTRAVLSFSPARTGIASWIREAGPMGGLEYVSPEALGLASGLSRDPASIIGELFAVLQAASPETWDDLVQFQQEHRIDLQFDLAAALGGELTFAIDGPVLPEPGWKVILEVYNSAALQNAIERMVFEFNRVAAGEARQQIEIGAETVGGRIYHVLRFGGEEAHYAFSGGYAIFGPNRPLVERAIEYSATRTGLGSSAAFGALLPAGEYNYCSAIVYHNLGPLVSTVSGFLTESEASPTGETLALLEEFAADRPPVLGCVIAEGNRIVALNEGDAVFDLLSFGAFHAFVERSPQQP